jgi:Malectin domain
MSKRVLICYAPSEQNLAERLMADLKSYDVESITQLHQANMTEGSSSVPIDGLIILLSDMALKSLSLRLTITRIVSHSGNKYVIIPVFLSSSSVTNAWKDLYPYLSILWYQGSYQDNFSSLLERLGIQFDVSTDDSAILLPVMPVNHQQDAESLQAFKLDYSSVPQSDTGKKRNFSISRWQASWVVALSLALTFLVIFNIRGAMSKQLVASPTVTPSLSSTQSIVAIYPTATSISHPGLTVTPSLHPTTPPTILINNPSPSPTTQLHPTSTASPTSSPSKLIYGLNCGGPAVSSFVADPFVDSSNTWSSSTQQTIDLSHAKNPAPQAIYQTEREGVFAYAFIKFPAGNKYIFRVHLAESDFSSSGKREFNILINDVLTVQNYDIFASAGGANKAIVLEIPVVADSNGQVAITFVAGAVGSPKCNGIEVAQP